MSSLFPELDVCRFSATIGDDIFADRALFEVAARAWRKPIITKPNLHRYFHDATRGLGSPVGDDVTFEHRGVELTGQVWSLAHEPAHLWVRGDDGHTYLVSKLGTAQRVDSLGRAIHTEGVIA